MARPGPGREMSEVPRDLLELRDDLRGMADELRLKIHLAGMDAKDAWSKLEPQLFAFEERAERAARMTAIELRLLAEDLKDDLQKIRDSV